MFWSFGIFFYFKWLRTEVIYTSLRPDSGHWPMKSSRVVFFSLVVYNFFFFILSFVVSLVISFLTSSFQWNCNCMCVSVNIPRHRFRLAGYRNSKNLAFEALLEMISVSGSIFITEKYFAFEWHEYIETDKHDTFIIVTFAAWSTLSLPFAVSKTKRKKKNISFKIDPKLLMCAAPELPTNIKSWCARFRSV